MATLYKLTGKGGRMLTRHRFTPLGEVLPWIEDRPLWAWSKPEVCEQCGERLEFWEERVCVVCDAVEGRGSDPLDWDE